MGSVKDYDLSIQLKLLRLEYQRLIIRFETSGSDFKLKKERAQELFKLVEYGSKPTVSDQMRPSITSLLQEKLNLLFAK